MRIISIDPRNTATSKASDLHLAIKSDGDTALFNGLLAEISRRGAVDQDYVTSHVDGFDAALAVAQSSNPADTGLSQKDIQTFYDIWIGSQKVVTIYSQGVNQSTGGSDKVNAIINCHLATGRIGRPGMGPFSVTGQPNAMGGREVGGLANMLACHLDIEDHNHRQTVQNHWQSPTICTKPGLKAVDLFKACATGKIKALWIISTNPVVSMPNAGNVANAIKNVDFTVVSEVMTKTDTSLLADVKLPATAWGEKPVPLPIQSGVSASREPFFRHPVKPGRIGKSSAMWLNAWAGRMSFLILARQKYFGNMQLSLAKPLLMALISISANWQRSATKTTLPSHRYNGRYLAARLVTDGFFPMEIFIIPMTKQRMVPVAAMQVESPEAETFQLNTGRIRDQWHTMTRSGKSSRLSQHLTEPFVEIHPDDAHLLELRDSDLVEIVPVDGTSDFRVVVRAKITEDVARGAIFVPMHWVRHMRLRRA